MLTDKQRMGLVDFYVRELLNRERITKNYDILEKLWNASGLTNKDLVDELMSDRENASDSFTDSIFWDMIWILKNEIMQSVSLREFFSDLYVKRFPRGDAFVKKMEKDVSDGKKVVFVPTDLVKNKFVDKNDSYEAEYVLFRMYNSDTIARNDVFDNRFIDMELRKMLSFAEREAEYSEDQLCYEDEKHEPVFKSKMYAKFVRRQKEALAEYIGVKSEELADCYHNVMSIVAVDQEDALKFHTSGFGIVSESMVEIVWLHGGASHWLENIQSTSKNNKNSYRYRPDFDKLLEKYCRARVKVLFTPSEDDEPELLPATLIRKAKCEDMEAFAESMAYMYMADCVYQMYVQMQKQYYEDFSWEHYRNRDLKTRYEQVISDLMSTISIRERELSNTRRLYDTLRMSLEQKSNEALRIELLEKERILKELADRDAEIERLKSKIASQNNLIEQLQVPEKDESEKVHLDAEMVEHALQEYRFLFVGDITALGFEELRYKFPSSAFMESSTMNISQLQVDAVVYLIQAMGHSMYYKCKNSANLNDSKIIYFNGRRNLQGLLEEIYYKLQ